MGAPSVAWTVRDTTARDLLVVKPQEVGSLVRVLTGGGALYPAVNPGVGSSVWGPATDGDTDEDAISALDTRMDAVEALNPIDRAYGQPTLLPITAGLLSVSDTAYWTYLGYFQAARTIKRVRFHIVTAGAGTQVAEVALASSGAAPNRASQALTKLAAQAIVDLDLAAATGLAANDSDLNLAVPAGTHAWAGIRFAMSVTQPTLLAVSGDMGQGQIGSTAAAGALTGVGPWTKAVITHALTAQAPALFVTLD